MTAGADRWSAALPRDLGDADGPGVAVGVYRDGVLASSGVSGLACLEHGVPIDTRTRFDLASVSKQMTAACALLLHSDGVVDLDADLRRWLPELRLGGLTLRGCLNHTTGLRDYEEVNPLRGAALTDLATLPQLLDWLAGATTTNFPPGSDVSYSNTGYVVVAAALSRAARRPFGDLMRERVFAPLGMEETLLRDTVGLVVPGMAFSYLPTPTSGYLRHEMPEEQVGDGAVLSSIEDLAGWHGFLVDGRGLGGDIRRQLVEPAVLGDGRRTRYGCGVALRTLDGHAVLAHSGSMYGFRAYLAAVPSLGLGVTVLANHGDADAGSVALGVLRRCLHGPSGGPPITRPAPAPPEDRTWFCPVTVDTLASRALPGGDLGLSAGDRTATLTWDGGAWQNEDGSLRVEPVRAEELLVTDGLGRVRRYLPTGTVPSAGTHQLAGSYDGAELGVVRVDRVGAGTVVVVGRQRSVLEWVASYDGDDVYLASGRRPVWVRRHAVEDSISLSTGNTVFARLPRTAESTGVSRPVDRRAGCLEGPPSRR